MNPQPAQIISTSTLDGAWEILPGCGFAVGQTIRVDRDSRKVIEATVGQQREKVKTEVVYLVETINGKPSHVPDGEGGFVFMPVELISGL